MSRPFRGSIAVAAGLLSEKQLRSPTWRQLYRDVYVRSDVELTHDLWCRAAGLVLPATAVIGGASAAHVHGADVAGRGAPVEVVSSEHMRRRAHMVVLRASLGDGDVANVCGLRVTSPVRTAFDLARGRPLDEAVVAIDALLVRRLVSLADIAAYADAGHRSWRGVHRLPDVLALAAGGAESPMETRLRLRLVQAGLPAPALQHRVYDERGGFLARLDLAYVAERLGVEYDGECHFDARSVRKDLRRQNALRAAGWSLLRFTSEDVFRHPQRLVAQVRAALAGKPGR